MARYVTVFILVMIFAGVLGKHSKGSKTPKTPGNIPRTPKSPRNCFSPKGSKLEYKTDEIVVDTLGSSYQSSSIIAFELKDSLACVLETRVEGDISSVTQTIYDYDDLTEYVISEDGTCTSQSISENRTLAADFFCIPEMAICDDYVTLGVGSEGMDAVICKLDKEEDGMVSNYTYITQRKSNFLVFNKMFGNGAGNVTTNTYCAFDLKSSITDPSMCDIPLSCTPTETESQVSYDMSWEKAEVNPKNIRGRTWEEAEVKTKNIRGRTWEEAEVKTKNTQLL